MYRIVSKIYEKSPVFFQNTYISMYGYYWKNRRFGSVFKEQLSEFKNRESFSSDDWIEYQTIELRKLLIHAYTTVPLYTNKYYEAGFMLADFENFNLSDLKRLPFLEKDELRKFGKSSLLSSKRDKGKFYSSSGSTGTPISVYFSKKFHQTWNAAYEVRVRNWAGVDYKMARGMIGGRRILPEATANSPYFRYNSAENQTYFSAYHLSEQTASNYVKGIVDNKVEYLVGYAMSIFILADFILKLNLDTPKLKAVLTSSEKLTPHMRLIIEKAFKCKVFDGYSGVEACGLISENNNGEFLFSPDTGIMEVLDEKGNQVRNGETGEVIATGLLNFDQPLIRYKIGDRVKVSNNQDNNFLKIDEIEGRVEDVLIALNGSKMVRFHGLFIDIPNLKASQIIQKELNLIQVNLVPDFGFDHKNETVIVQRLKSQLGEVNVEFKYLDSIPKEVNGKFKAVKSNL